MSWCKGKKWLSGLLALTLAVSPVQWLPGSASVAEAAADNLALNKPTKTSQGSSGANVVDGDPTTFWQPSMADRQDNNVWLQVDLGTETSFNTVVIDISRVTMSQLRCCIRTTRATGKRRQSNRAEFNCWIRLRFRQ